MPRQRTTPKADDVVALHVLTGHGRKVIPAIVTKVSGKGSDLRVEVDTWDATGEAHAFGKPLERHDPGDWKPNTWAPMARRQARQLAGVTAPAGDDDDANEETSGGGGGK